MKNFINSINEKLHERGRYGVDAFSRTLLIIAAVCFLLGLLFGFWFFFLYTLFLVVWACIRILSKKTDKRESELEAYEAIVERNHENTALIKRKWADRKTHRYFRCKYCNTVFRIPKGKGKVSVTCPGCKEQFIKRT